MRKYCCHFSVLNIDELNWEIDKIIIDIKNNRFHICESSRDVYPLVLTRTYYSLVEWDWFNTENQWKTFEYFSPFAISIRITITIAQDFESEQNYFQYCDLNIKPDITWYGITLSSQCFESILPSVHLYFSMQRSCSISHFVVISLHFHQFWSKIIIQDEMYSSFQILIMHGISSDFTWYSYYWWSSQFSYHSLVDRRE